MSPALISLESQIRVLQVERDYLVRRRDAAMAAGGEIDLARPLLTASAADLIAAAAADIDCAPAERPWCFAFSQLIQPNREPTT